jgi:tripartite-type tricarboxylate transporter receptor subunit TctC
MNTNRRTFAATLLASVALLGAGPAAAQAFPAKPFRIVVGAPPGGTADLMARLLAEGLTAQFGQSVIVDNRPGAAGLLGVQELLKSPRDGYTLMVGVNGLVSEVPHAMKLPIDPMKELYPLVELGRSGLLFVGSPAVPASNLKEVVAHIKANPGKISYASYSPGSLSHTLGLAFNRIMGTDMTHVGYKGSPPALADVMAGHVSYMFDGPATSIPHIRSGKLKVFATSAPARISALPDVPTFAELGYGQLTETAWMGLWVTPDVPAPIQARLHEAVIKVMAQPAVQQKFRELGMDVAASPTPDELMLSLRIASKRQADILAAIGFKLE